jgi:hypothetical protein
MNIFVTSPDPWRCAIMLDDRRLSKMCVESAQLLCTAMHVACAEQGVTLHIPYKRTHVNHPCSVWTRQSRGNFSWLLELLRSLTFEFYLRRGKGHKCATLVPTLRRGVELFSGPQTMFVNCSRHKDFNDVIDAYRHTMLCKWLESAATWTLRDPPNWYWRYKRHVVYRERP